MDVYRYKMSKYLRDNIFSPCRSKPELIVKLTEAIAELTFTPESTDCFDVVIAIGKFQRIFFISDDKIFSVFFPFSIKRSEELGGPHFLDMNGVAIDSFILSRAATAVKSGLVDGKDIYSFADSVISCFTVSDVEGVEVISDDVWEVVKRLIMMEEGYLRYDNDPANFDELTHPLDHLDIFYSPSCTFKVGLAGRIDHNAFLDILDPRTRCRIFNN